MVPVWAGGPRLHADAAAEQRLFSVTMFKWTWSFSWAVDSGQVPFAVCAPQPVMKAPSPQEKTNKPNTETRASISVCENVWILACWTMVKQRILLWTWTLIPGCLTGCLTDCLSQTSPLMSSSHWHHTTTRLLLARIRGNDTICCDMLQFNRHDDLYLHTF